MGAVAVISLAEGREQKPRAEVRQQLHESFERWVDTLAEHGKEPKPTLEQLSRAVWERRQERMGRLTQALLEQRYGTDQGQHYAPCPPWGHTVAARAVTSRTLETWVGEVEGARPSFYCVPCGHGCSPLEAALGLAEGRKPFDLPQGAVKLTAAVPYETARELFAELSGMSLGTERLQTLTNAVAEGWGILAVAPTRAELVEQLAAVAAGRRRRPLLGLASDGASVPTRPETAKGSRPGRKKARAKRARWQGQGREARAFASTGRMRTASCLCSAGSRCTTTRQGLPPWSRLRPRA